MLGAKPEPWEVGGSRKSTQIENVVGVSPPQAIQNILSQTITSAVSKSYRQGCRAKVGCARARGPRRGGRGERGSGRGRATGGGREEGRSTQEWIDITGEKLRMEHASEMETEISDHPATGSKEISSTTPTQGEELRRT